MFLYLYVRLVLLLPLYTKFLKFKYLPGTPLSSAYFNVIIKCIWYCYKANSLTCNL